MAAIEPHETWKILDSSKLQTYMRCPRRYFYRYILGWAPDGDNFHLVFGRAWHKAMEVLLTDRPPTERTYERAFAAFYEVYREVVEKDGDYGGKTAEAAAEAIVQYGREHAHDEFDVLLIEASGQVPLTMDLWMHFRLDAVLKDERGIYVLEHKTTGRNTRQWRDQWPLSTQVGLYTHVLYSLYDPDEVYGVIINGAVFKKTGIEFIRLPVRQTPKTMNVWWTHTRRWIDMLLHDMERLEQASVDDQVLKAFPMCTTSCTDFYGCPYADLCMAWPNPLREAAEPPLGFHVEWWDPRDEDSKTRLEVKGDEPGADD